MSNFPSYPTRSFSETQKFFVLDPQTGTPSFVLGSDLVSYITPSLAVVQAELTTDTAKTVNFSVGVVIQTTGGSAVGDGDPGLFLVVGSGDGDIPMDNGNELLILAGANAAMGISYDNSSSGLQSTNVQAAIDELTGTSEIINVSVAGASDYTLTAADLVYSGFNLTGTLTGDINVIVPDTSRRYTFVNSTSGSFTVTVKTSGGTGVLLPQGELRQVRCDGTNVITGDGFSDFTSMPEVSGDPIVEETTTATSHVIKFSSGLAIETITDTAPITLASVGQIFQSSADVDVSYSAGFVSKPAVSVDNKNVTLWCSQTGGGDNTQCSFRPFSYTDANTSVDYEIVAVGRWK